MNHMLLAAGLSFAVCVVVFPFYIGWLKKRQIQQFIREEGPQSHAAKAKTPTMGGLCFLLLSTAVSATLILVLKLPAAGPALAVVATAALCGLVGFIDDFAKINSRSNAGISAKVRLMSEFGLGFLLAGALLLMGGNAIDQLVLNPAAPPFTLSGMSDITRLAYVFCVVPFLVAATTNAMNLHDGMDGLAGGTGLLTFITMGAMLALLPAASVPVAQALAVVAFSVAGGLAAFLVYNKFPAKVFMGDTGSLFLGGMMAAMVATSGLTLWFIPLSLLYVLEAVSVMAQVSYFKLTKQYQPETPMSRPALIWLKLTKRLPGEGKRLFRMAPLHHHFEAIAEDKGIAEWQVVACFWLLQLLICACTYGLFFYIHGMGG